MSLSLVPPLPPKITFSVETRPSPISGHAWWAVLRYGTTHVFEELLPFELPSLPGDERDAAVLRAAHRLQAQLAPVLMAEDWNGEV
jgi:hypothetical protein